MELDKERLLRFAVAALLGSNLKELELRFLAELLSRDSKFCLRFAETLDSVAKEFGGRAIEAPSSIRPSKASTTSPTGVASLLIEAIRKKKYAKDRIAQVFMNVSGSGRWISDAQSLSMGELVSRFVDTASDEEISEVLRKLGTAVARDPFLGGIGSRKAK